LVDYLNKFYHPMCTAIVTQEHAEITEGIMVTKFKLMD